MDKHYFISDVHLGFFDRERDRKREDLFLDFMDHVAREGDSLYLLGDIFDYWFEYKTVVPAYFYRTLAKLAELVKCGVRIVYVMGNHDFGHKDFFKNELGIDVIREDKEVEIDGVKIYLAHGDGKSHKDTGYLILKKILRSAWANKIFRWIHPDLGIGLASGSSQKSRQHTDSKDYGDSDGIKDFALSKIKEGYDYVLMGHRHKFEEITLEGGTYINLGEWISANPFYALLEGGSIRTGKVKELLKSHKEA
jgi:UDP-2,3-diacylglucosamine hydrolase